MVYYIKKEAHMKKLLALILGLFIIGSAGLVAADVNPSSSPSPTATPTIILSSNLAGTETQILPKNYDVWSCDWEPTGKSLVFAGKLQGEDAAKMRIWYWSLDPMRDPTPLTNTDQLVDFSPRWSPDDTKVIMTRRNYGKLNNNITSTIWLKEMPGGAGKQLTSGPEDRDPSWSPDSTQAVFSSGDGPYKARLMIVNLTDGSITQLAGEDNVLLNSPWWGKNGKIYFTKLSPAPKNVTFSGQTYQVMDFGKGSIWAIDPVDKSTTPIVVDEYDNRLPALSPDGTKLAYVSSRAQSKDGNGKFDRGSLYIKNLVSGEVSYITNKVGLNGGALSFSPDGKRLAFFTFRSIRPSVWVINIP